MAAPCPVRCLFLHADTRWPPLGWGVEPAVQQKSADPWLDIMDMSPGATPPPALCMNRVMAGGSWLGMGRTLHNESKGCTAQR